MAGRGFTDEFRVRIRGLFCIYCGVVADSDEHFPPKTYSMYGVILPACRECNSFAGTAFAADMAERVRYVHSKLRKKYKRLLSVPEWSQEELDECGPGVRSVVKKWRVDITDIKQRLIWDPLAYLAAIDHSGAVAGASARMARIIAHEKKKVRKAKAKAAEIAA